MYVAGPRWRRGFKSNGRAVLGVPERHSVAVQAKRGVFYRYCLNFTELVARPVHGVARYRPAQVPEVDSNLVRPAGEWCDTQECCPVRSPFDHFEFCESLDTGIWIYHA